MSKKMASISRKRDVTSRVESQAGYTATVIFRGLCPFVPGRELAANVKHKWFGSFLINANEANQKRFQIAKPVHFPCLRFRLNELLGMSAAPNAESLVRLAFEDVVFVPPPDSKKGLTVNFAEKVGEKPTKKGEEKFYNWVARLDDVMPGRGEVDSECFQKNELVQRIVARVHIVQGLLQTGDVGRISVGGRPVVARLNEGAKEKRQAVAHHVELIIDCSPGPFKIRMRPFKGGEVREIVFDQPKDSKLNIEVVNLCADELIRERDSQGQVVGNVEDPFSPDEDFRWNFVVSKGVTAVTNASIPIPVREKLSIDPRDAGGGTDAARCSPPGTQAAPSQVDNMLSIVNDLSTPKT